MNAFDSLRQTDEPVEPDRRFAADLRARLTAALTPTIDLPDRTERTIMSNSETAPASTGATAAAPADVVAYLAVQGAARAIDWYTDVFGATEATRYVGDDDRIGHAELRINGGRIFLSDEYPEIGVTAPPTIGGSATALVANVPDVDAVHAAAVAAGATSLRPPEDQPYGDRSATIVDPFGHRWMVQTTVAQPTAAEIDEAMEGYTVTHSDAAAGADTDDAPAEIGYVTFSFDDTERAVRFYEAVFGWHAEPGHAGPGYAHVANTRLPMGMTPDGSDTPPMIYVRVADAEAAAARVVEAGGEIVSRFDSAAGTNIGCHDDQGSAFTIWQPAPGY